MVSPLTSPIEASWVFRAPTDATLVLTTGRQHGDLAEIPRKYTHHDDRDDYTDDDEEDSESSFIPRSPVLSNKRPSVSHSPSRARRPSMPAAPHLSRTKSQTEKYNNYRWLSNTGSEPGIDVTQDPGRYAEMKDEVQVTVVDYSDDGPATRVDLPGKKLERWLNSDSGRRPVSPAAGKAGDEKKKTRKSVRWINLDGTCQPSLQFVLRMVTRTDTACLT